MAKTENKIQSKKTKGAPAAGKSEKKTQAAAGAASFPIVGVGASAGGLEAFMELLKALRPQLGMAFVLIPHLDPHHESALTELLSRATKMPVLQVEHGQRVTPDHVYVIPPGQEMTIRQGILQLAARQKQRPMSIDTFLRSLAEDRRNNAIGVILSGTATDGTLGLAAIKGEGGITFAQDPKTAKYDGMPSSAIASGVVDFILKPAMIAKELAHIRRHPYIAVAADEKVEPLPAEGDHDMATVFRVLKEATKVDFSDYKGGTLRRRILRRMALKKISNFSEYVSYLRTHREEALALYDDILINVTSFFRSPDTFDALKQTVYPALLKDRPPTDTIRIWVPGCSTGEEAYSHAICLMEYLSDVRAEVSMQIFATDLSEPAVQRARAGIYKENITADISPARLRRFFTKVEGGYQINKFIRDLCIFARQNVFTDPPFSKMDIVSCRNLLIYLGAALQRRVIPVFHYALRPKGFLMLGNAEGLLLTGTELFDLVDRKNKIYAKRPGPSPVSFGFNVERFETTGAEPPPGEAREPEQVKAPADAQREGDRLLLAKYVPAAVVVNEHMDILQTRGHTGRYLELPPGKATLNLMRMARPGLMFELQRALDAARMGNAPVARDNLQVQSDGDPRLVNIEVVPFRVGNNSQQNFLIVFHESQPGAAPPAVREDQPSEPEAGLPKERQIEQLKQELVGTKEYLQSVIEQREATNEELQSANEEIQSANEELQSTNEELQTSKEELESANEELNTVNEEMQHRNLQLSQALNDLTNLLNSVNIAIVMLGPDLSVRRYTANAEKALGLSAADVGRAIGNVKMKINMEGLEQSVEDVIRDVIPKQREFQDHGSHYNLRITPYRTSDNKIEGVVLVLLDITELRQSQQRERKGRK